MKVIVRLIVVLLVLVALAGGGYILTHGEQPPAPVMVHHDLTPRAEPSVPAQTNGGTSLPELPPVGGH
ncbi:hypothetical protein [Bombella saccharophila]|uniref:Uncharacterized protein n=1 Tax=Bombella saccharophila TaxID=2967338 RepID=A0ABT3W528_9PROT|nr:hypothetical protein [Bombella saccharophila]MCX5613868.1 hypothetical protein [Bombella saccharophila]PHI97401.1 hypothetical protein BG621_01045 [Parasaccharibacter apium]